jgi:hypothetical protein
MSRTRKQLEQIAVILFAEQLGSWPMANLVAFINDTAVSRSRAHSVRERRLKQQIDALLITSVSTQDIGPPSAGEN